jgi:transcriptional regulator GlxA family with amidase domain
VRAAATMLDAVFLIQPHALLLDLAGPAEALRLANQALQRRGRPRPAAPPPRPRPPAPARRRFACATWRRSRGRSPPWT